MTMFQIVTNNARTAEVFETTDPVADFAARGFTYTGPETHGHLRAELRRKPRFRGLAGPMWGGTTPRAIRSSGTRIGIATTSCRGSSVSGLRAGFPTT